jgi:hypothetical protein
MNRTTGNPIDPLRRLAGNVVIIAGMLWSLFCAASVAFFLYLILRHGAKGLTTGGLVSELALVLFPGAIGLGVGWLSIASGRAIGGRTVKKNVAAD